MSILQAIFKTQSILIPVRELSTSLQRGGVDIFVSKLDASGNFIWAKNIGGTGNDQGHSITIDYSGNVYLTGSFQNTVDFDPGSGIFNLTSTGGADIFISKLDTSGNFIWAKKLGGAGLDQSYSIAVDDSLSIYTTGFFQNTADFDPGVGVFNLTPSGYNDIFVSKLDSSGNFIWAKKMGGTNSDKGLSIAVDVYGNVYTTGFFQDTADFDPGLGVFSLTSAGFTDFFISKLDALGNFIWAKRVGGQYTDQASSIAVDASACVYTTGYFNGTVDFNPDTGTFNLNSISGSDIFVSKLDSLGDFLWAKKMSGSGFQHGRSIALDNSKNVYTTGSFNGTVDFDPGIGIFNLTSATLAGYRDIFVSKLDASGNFIWARSMGGKGDDQGNSIAVDSLGNVYSTGDFEDTLDFNLTTGIFTLTSTGGDIFVSKWSQCFIDTSTTINNNALIANQQNANYQWLNCDSSYSAISGATNQSFTPSQNGNYACEVSLNGCVDTTACIQVIVTGIEKNVLSEAYKIYPSPFADQVTIESVGVHSNTKLEVINIKGQVVYESTTLLNGKTVLNTADWAKGIYFIRLTNEQSVGTFKLAHQ